MQKLLVYADFDWLKEPTLMGELSYESLRGEDSYGFSFDEEWLRKAGELFLSADLNNYLGVQYTAAGCDIFGCFSDALPDRWGRTLLNRREQLLAQEEGRPLLRLSSFDYLLGIDDYSRMGGFRFKERADADFINSTPTLRVPPLANIRDLEFAARQIEQSEQQNELPDKKWIAQLIQPGSSLGGARPKASVIDTDGSLCVAKFPSRQDDWDAELWEHLSHMLAKRAGISVAETRVLQTSDRRHTLISRRFDRTKSGKRIHFASAMTLLGLHDGDNATNGHGYLDIVDFIIRYGADVDNNLRELYRRVAFNICIGNSDDHFRNHGFLLIPKGWTLSPAYDLNPTLSRHQSLLITATSNEADLSLLGDASEEYMLSRPVADSIISEVCDALKDWQTLATQLGVPKREIASFADRWTPKG
ncbi:type II toxin-antitoxin system HipA family toxin [Porphyromonas uenonis]|uniref:type II toxin-antitoxin system HipA family toxin n=1 Tax=Porphyromonas uenonis TaxID=281920 RepID=UPI0026EBE64F|nr:type II toxin-antitoxin system HipA family toxin [Porphyromonas uenonis]